MIMHGHFNWLGRPLRVDYSAGRSLAIPLDPHGKQPSFFTSTRMSAEPLREGSFVGDVRLGGSCNAELVHWAPHCHGTHTECIGHILPERLKVTDTIDTSPVLARLVSLNHTDGQLSFAELEMGLAGRNHEFAALIIRTLPNAPGKQWRNYSTGPDFPAPNLAAMSWLSALPLRHLLLDTPSLDRATNQNLDNHRTWWGENPAVGLHGFPPRQRSVTEMIFVSDDIPDGEYWLHLELSPLSGDATPSRPVIYPVE